MIFPFSLFNKRGKRVKALSRLFEYQRGKDKKMFTIEHTTREFLEALERLNKKQNEKNVFTNISDEDVFREIARYRNINKTKD